MPVAMPTAPKLVSAVMLGALGWYASELIKPLFPEGSDLGRFSELNAVLGLIIGWRFVGARMGQGYPNATAFGLTGVALLVVWGLFVNSFYVMITRSLRKSYDGATEAVLAVFQLMLEHGEMMLHLPLIVVLVVGGLVIGVVAEWSFGR